MRGLGGCSVWDRIGLGGIEPCNSARFSLRQTAGVLPIEPQSLLRIDFFFHQYDDLLHSYQ